MTWAKRRGGPRRRDERGNIGGGKRVIRKNRFNTKLLPFSRARARFEEENAATSLSPRFLVLKPKRHRHTSRYSRVLVSTTPKRSPPGASLVLLSRLHPQLLPRHPFYSARCTSRRRMPGTLRSRLRLRRLGLHGS